MSHPGDLRNGKGEKNFFRGNPGIAVDFLWGGVACILDAVAPETLAGLENLFAECRLAYCGKEGW